MVDPSAVEQCPSIDPMTNVQRIYKSLPPVAAVQDIEILMTLVRNVSYFRTVETVQLRSLKDSTITRGNRSSLVRETSDCVLGTPSSLQAVCLHIPQMRQLLTQRTDDY